MKKILLFIVLLVASTGLYAQISTLQQPFRVVVVSPNYPNTYPRFNTLQATYNAIKDSANVTTGKYFIVNVTTSYNNITDWTGAYKDSLNNRSPYIKLVAFGNAITDSILSVDVDEFNLIGGVLSLNANTAGDGLSFVNHAYNVNLLRPLLLSNDSLFFAYSNPLYLTPNTLGLRRNVYSGLQVNDSGLRVLPQLPLKLSSDTLKMIFGAPFIASDSVYLNYNTEQFDVAYNVSPSLSLKLDSGLTTISTGVKVNVDNATIKMNSSKKLYVDFVGTLGDMFKVDPATGKYILYDAEPIEFYQDTIITLNYNTDAFALQPTSNSLSLKVDSGLTTGTQYHTTPKVLKDNNELSFNSSKELETATSLWGGGLVKTGDSGNVVVNEFAKIENDTTKIKTSYTFVFYGDSLTSNVTSVGRGVLPYDTTGVPVIYTGKIKRVTFTYQLSSNNDTIKVQYENTSVTFGDKIRGSWNNGGSKFNIQKWSQSSRTWSTAIQLDFGSFANKPFRVVIELYAEAQ